MQILFIGGTGLISTACAAATVAAGHDLWLMNRGLSKLPSAVPPERALRADAADEQQVRSAVQGRNWDVVVDWVAYKPRQVEQDMRVFAAAGQYIFISSASVYEKPPSHWVITESTPRVNPFWQYSRDKIACEEVLRHAWERSGFPATVVRPTLTYGPSQIPVAVGSWAKPYTIVDRMRRGRASSCQETGPASGLLPTGRISPKDCSGFSASPALSVRTSTSPRMKPSRGTRFYALVGAAAGVDPNILHVPSRGHNRVSPRSGARFMGRQVPQRRIRQFEIAQPRPGL